MVGGKVIDIWIWHEDCVELAVRDGNDYCGVRVEKNPVSMCIQRGDSVWWQNSMLVWTAADGSMNDYFLPKIGNSYGLPDDQTITNGRVAFNETRQRV